MSILRNNKEIMELSEDKKTLIKCYTRKKTIVVPNTVEVIGEFAFMFSLDLELIIFPDNLKKIERGIIYTTGVKKLFIPALVDEIAIDAFHGADYLTEITVDPRNKTFRSYQAMLFDYDITTLLCLPNDNSNPILELPTSVTDITHFAIGPNAHVIVLYISENLRLPEWNVFSGLVSLKVVNLHENNPYLKLKNNLLLSRDETTVVSYFSLTKTSIVRFPRNVKNVLSEAFYYPSYIRHIHLNRNLQAIYETAFLFNVDFEEINFYYPLTREHFATNVKNEDAALFKQAALHFKN